MAKTQKAPQLLSLDVNVAGVPITFTCVPTIGRATFDTVDTDLALITKVHTMDLPTALRFSDNTVMQKVTETVRSDFPGRCGTFKVLSVPLRNSRLTEGRHLMFFGLGSCQQYDGNIVCETFDTLFRQALDLNVESVAVPFIPNPMTKDCLTHKATAFKLKDVLRKVIEKAEAPVKLREVKLWCSASAVRHIVGALKGDTGEGCYCEVHDD